jgi:hypothetical protein
VSTRLSAGNRYHPVVAALCRAEGWPVPDAELVFAAPRRWRFDLAWPAERLAVEVNGGVFMAGRHARGAGLRNDYEKLNTAQLMGWRVIQILPEQITDGTLTSLLTRAFMARGGE